MGASDGLTPDLLAELRALLLQTQAELERGRDASSRDAMPVDLGLAIGRLSRVDALQAQHMAMARKQRIDAQLQQVRGALSRMEAGTYGACTSCSDPIGQKRLRARPETPLCHNCQAGLRGS